MYEKSEANKALCDTLPWSDRPVWRGIDCGDGWLPIIERLDARLREISSDYRVVQVKEKFGTLRYYTDGFKGETWDAYANAVRQAEAESAVTCEVCGSAGVLDTELRWIRTLCPEHSREARAVQAARLLEYAIEEDDD